MKKPLLPTELFEILPSSPIPTDLPISLKPPAPDGKIEEKGPTLKDVFEKEIKRKWHDGLIGKKSESIQCDNLAKRSRHLSKNKMTPQHSLQWAQEFYSKIMLCKIDDVGWGVFVRSNQVLKEGSCLCYSGIVDFSLKEFNTNTHAGAVYDVITHNFVALIDPTQYGGISDLVNHAFSKEQLEQFFEFKDPSLIEKIATPNVRLAKTFYQGFPIPFLEVAGDILGCQQLLLNYSSPYEFTASDGSLNKTLRLFDKQWQSIASDQYELKYIQIAVRESKNHSITCLTISRWALWDDLEGAKPKKFIFLEQHSITKYKIPAELIKAQLQKKPDAALLIFAVPESKILTPASIIDPIVVNHFDVGHDKDKAISFWLNWLLPPPKGGQGWASFTHTESKQKFAVIPVKKEEEQVYVAHFKKLPNMAEKLIYSEIEDKSLVGFVVDKWWSLYDLPYSPCPVSVAVTETPTSSSSSSMSTASSPLLATHSITTSSKKKPVKIAEKQDFNPRLGTG